ncbi:V-type ATP synthase subunit I [Spirochaetia bacterium]|nr:V-type ATP synthase subunit I [Spirochaetia bacterium]
MIVPMKKVSILVMDKNKEASLEKIREIGLLHVEKKEVQSDNLSKLIERKTKIEQAKGILSTYAPKKGEKVAALAPVTDLANYIFDLTNKKKSAQDKFFSNAKELNRIEKWGNFDPSAFKYFTDKGLTLVPYELSLKSYNALGDDIKLIVLKKSKTLVYCLSLGGPIENEQQFILPEHSLNGIKKEQEELLQIVADVEKEFVGLYPQLDALNKDIAQVNAEIEFETAKTGMESIDEDSKELNVVWITGFVPTPEIGVLKRQSAENGWALYAEDPAESDAPPTLIKNNAFVRLIQPLFSFLGTIPGYREYDISFSYLIFFCLFFAMIFGDAAYGSIVFIITFIIGLNYKKKTGKVPDAVKLFVLLSLCTMAWGTLNGAWFAIPYDNLPRFLQSLVLPQFNSENSIQPFPWFLEFLYKLTPENLKELNKGDSVYWNVQFLCFTVAIIQLVYARLKNVLKLLPSPVAIAQFGWLVMMIGLYFLVLFMLLKIPLPPFAMYLMVIGVALYFIFAEQKGGNVFANIGKSFANFLTIFLNVVGSFADIISYIRLFAVGLAGTSIAQSFNSMSGIGQGLGDNILSIVLKLLGAILILLFGHGLNMVMNALSVIVHGVRLNLLEYAGNHLGIEWSGYSYKPFAVKQEKN